MEYNKRCYDVFSEHKLNASVLENSEYKYSVYELSKDNSNIYRVKFTVGGGHTLVTGDLGTYVFEREFHPQPNGTVSDDYWISKIPSSMEPLQYSEKETLSLINDLIKNIDDYGYEENKDKIIDALYKAAEYAHNEFEYYNHVHYSSELSNLIESEDIPWGRDYNHRIDYIFDAFEKMCSILESRES